MPFLLWVAATQMQREDLRRRWQAEYALAQTLGLEDTLTRSAAGGTAQPPVIAI